jgi:hypothetical protein
MRAILTLLVAVLLSACNTAPPRPATINHVVLAWFKDTVSAAEIAEIRARSLELRGIPGLETIQAGSAVPSERPIVDDSFDLGLVMGFESVQAMQVYLTHPSHLAFVERYLKGKVERLLVYDIASTAP